VVKKAKGQKKWKKNDDEDEDLTLDEARALQLYQEGKKKKKIIEAKLEIEEDVEENEQEEDGEDGEHRLITRQIEKNKGLTPKRSKLQRNP